MEDVQRILAPLAHLISIRQGRFDPLDRWVTQQDLINAGLQTTESVEAPVIIESPAAAYPFTLQGDIVGGPTSMGTGDPTTMLTAINLPNVVEIDGGDSASTFPGEVTGPYGVVEFSLEARDEGVQVLANTKIIDFVGAGVTVTNPSGDQIRVDIPGGGGGGTPTEGDSPFGIIGSGIGSANISILEFRQSNQTVDARIGYVINGNNLLDFTADPVNAQIRIGTTDPSNATGVTFLTGNVTVANFFSEQLLMRSEIDLSFEEKADHAATVVAGRGYLWLRNDRTLMFTDDTSVDYAVAGLNSDAAPGGADGAVQYNNGGVFGATTMTFNDTNNQLTINGISTGEVLNVFGTTTTGANYVMNVGGNNASLTGEVLGIDYSGSGTADTLRLRQDGTGRLLVMEDSGVEVTSFNALGYLVVYPGTPNDGDVLAWNNTNSRYEATAPSGGGIGGSITDNQIAFGALTANDIEGSADLTWNGTAMTIGGTGPQLNFGTNGYVSGGGGVGLLIQSDSGGGLVLQQRVNGGLIRMGADDLGGTFRKVYESTHDQTELFATNGTRRMLIDQFAVTIDNTDLRFPERADHASTPAAGFGYLWVRNDTPNVLVFTDDAGTDTVLGAGGGGIGGSIAATQVAVGSTTADEIEGSSLLIFNSGSSYLGVGGGTAAFASITANVSATGSGNFIFQQNSVTKAFLAFDNATQDLFVDSDGDIVFYPSNTSTVTIKTTGVEVDGNLLSYTKAENKIARAGATDSFTGLDGAQWVEIYIEDYDPNSTNDIWFRPEYSSGTVQTSGYNSYCLNEPGGSAANVTSGPFTNTFSLVTSGTTGSFTGRIRFTKADDNLNEWTAHGEFIDTVNDEKYTVTGHVLLSGALTGIRINNSAATTGDTGDLYCIWGT